MTDRDSFIDAFFREKYSAGGSGGVLGGHEAAVGARWDAWESCGLDESRGTVQHKDDWPDNLRRAADRMADLLKIRHDVLRLNGQVGRLTTALETMKQSQGVIVPIQTFAPEPYDLTTPLFFVVRPDEQEYRASFFDANLSAMGDNESEAVANLKLLVLDTFDSLTSRPIKKLGPAPAKQLAVLQGLIRKRV
jgi:hypothetical protein